jgi:hypothetical protein
MDRSNHIVLCAGEPMKTDMGMTCVITTGIDEILKCLDQECPLECLSKINSLHAEIFILVLTAWHVLSTIAPTKMIITTPAIPTKGTLMNQMTPLLLIS